MIVVYCALGLLGLLVLVHLLRRIARDPVLGVGIYIFLSAITETPDLPLIGDRLIAADAVMLFVILVCAFKGILFRPAPPALRAIDQLAALFIMIVAISSLLALFTRGEPARVILFLMIYVYCYLSFRTILRLLTTEDALRRIFIWWIAAIVMVIAVGFLAATGIYRPSWTFDPVINRINSTFKLSGQVSSYLGPAMFLLFYLATMRESRVWVRGAFVALLLAGAYVMLGTGSRISFVMMAVGMFLGTIVIMTTPARIVCWRELAIAIGLGMAAFVSFVVTVWTDTSTRYGLTTTSPFERALRMWSEQTAGDEIELAKLGGTRAEEVSVAIANLHNHLFLGTGAGMFSRTYGINEIHNTYVAVLAENGLLAFIAMTCWWTAVGLFLMTTAYRMSGHSCLIMRLVLLAFVSVTIYQITTDGLRQRPFWFVPAIALATAQVLRQRASNERRTRAPDTRPSAGSPVTLLRS